MRRIPVFEAAFLRSRQNEGPVVYRDPRVDKIIELEILRIERMEEIASRYIVGNEKPSKDKIAEQTHAKYKELLAPPSNQPVANESENQEMLAKIARYETSLMNSITRTLNMLMGLQNMRGERAERQRLIGVNRSAPGN